METCALYLITHTTADLFFPVQACNQSDLQVELVVNVDSPVDAAAWAAESNATGGLVVPVLSANVHEVWAKL